MGGRDPEGYFAENAVIWSDLSDCDLVVGGGDLNSRSKEELDFLPDIDGNLIPPRTNPDQFKNSHGDCFLQFLKDNRSLICNGRITPHQNDFTFLSTRGRSVPDYIYCPADHLQYCKIAKVIKVSDVINDYKLNIPSSLPDHSIVVCKFDISTNTVLNDLSTTSQQPSQAIPQNVQFARKKKNLKKMGPEFFLSQEVLEQVNTTIAKLEIMNVNQATMNDIYSEIKRMFLMEMSKLPDLPSPSDKK